LLATLAVLACVVLQVQGGVEELHHAPPSGPLGLAALLQQPSALRGTGRRGAVRKLGEAKARCEPALEAGAVLQEGPPACHVRAQRSRPAPQQPLWGKLTSEAAGPD
jgi:hypothetical protein